MAPLKIGRKKLAGIADTYSVEHVAVDEGVNTVPTGALARSGRLLRVREVADTLAVSTMTVYRLINGGDLRAIRVGRGWRVAEEELAAYLDRQVV